MQRADKTSVEYQANYDGIHFPVSKWGGFNGITMKCSCGWRMRQIPFNSEGSWRAVSAYNQHINKMEGRTGR